MALAAIERREGKEAPTAPERAWLEIDLEHLRHNVQEIRRVLSPGCDLMAVVKANAYGHGAVEVARELNKVGVRAFAVATVQEGVRLRQHGIEGDILVLGYTHHERFPDLARYGLIQTIVDAGYAGHLNRLGCPVRVHVKVDTGMHRLGISYDQVECIHRIYACENLVVEGIYTHLCASDNLSAPDVAFTHEQIRRFQRTVEVIRRLGYRPGKIHAQSSYGLLNYPELGYDYARVGIALYGVLSGLDDHTQASLDLRPVLSLKARVAAVREIAPGETVGYNRSFRAGHSTRIAVVTIGYADGVPRNLSCGKGHVLVNGTRTVTVGWICMDQMTIDISAIPDVKPGDIVTLIGQDGAERISAEQMAANAGTITNELLSRLGARPARVYLAPRP